MQPVYLFDLAARHADWASVRQALVTGNIANANTAGYQAVDIEPFSAVLNSTGGTAMATTAPGHIGNAANPDGGNRVDGYGVTTTGGPVALDMELVKADEINRAYALDMSILRSFQRMLLASVRTGS
ncbi:flagellar basal body protein [Enterovirga sp.]|uniref:flagellar basal body protein n=1 Tax=Enterovirga sp. TaxID=2026350 RepID=UPI002B96BE81|nr:flagellar basal body protein [Enterovirga sp.]HMO30756.1 flagellar basal body protein [Enterovirga sp.]